MRMPRSYSGINTLLRRTVLEGISNRPDFVLATILMPTGNFEPMWWGLFRLLMGGAVLGCIAASATFAFEFGWTRGATDTHRLTLALSGVALDLVKSGLPIFGAQAWHERNPARALACWLVFIVLTGLSLWSAYGTTAIQLASRIATQVVA